MNKGTHQTNYNAISPRKDTTGDALRVGAEVVKDQFKFPGQDQIMDTAGGFKDTMRGLTANQMTKDAALASVNRGAPQSVINALLKGQAPDQEDGERFVRRLYNEGSRMQKAAMDAVVKKQGYPDFFRNNSSSNANNANRNKNSGQSTGQNKSSFNKNNQYFNNPTQSRNTATTTSDNQRSTTTTPTNSNSGNQNDHFNFKLSTLRAEERNREKSQDTQQQRTNVNIITSSTQNQGANHNNGGNTPRFGGSNAIVQDAKVFGPRVQTSHSPISPSKQNDTVPTKKSGR